MSFTDLDAADACAEIYAGGSWDELWDEDRWGICVGLRRFPDWDLVVPRGSLSPLDWWDDVISEAALHDPDLGPLPYGFARPLAKWFKVAAPVIRPGAVIVGHSLGAAHAFEIGGKLVKVGKPPAAIVGFGLPRPGTQELWAVLNGVPNRWYDNGGDPVPDKPVPLPPVLPWVSRAGSPLAVPPAPGDDGMFRCHHIALYQAGVKALPSVPVIIA